MFEGKAEPGHAGQHRGQQKERSPGVEPFRREQPEQHDETRNDPYQADNDVHLGKRREGHA